MKKAMLGLVLLVTSPLVAQPYFEGEAGYVGSGNLQGGLVGVRMGNEIKGVDYSFAYTRASGDLDSEGITSNGLDLHTLSIEAYPTVYAGNRITCRVGGGLGYSIPTLSGPEKADSGLSYLVGGGADYYVNETLSIGVMVKGFFFRTDTRRIVNNSHMETLSNGQQVEVLDLDYVGGRLNLDSVLMTVGIKVHF